MTAKPHLADVTSARCINIYMFINRADVVEYFIITKLAGELDLSFNQLGPMNGSCESFSSRQCPGHRENVRPTGGRSCVCVYTRARSPSCVFIKFRGKLELDGRVYFARAIIKKLKRHET